MRLSATSIIASVRVLGVDDDQHHATPLGNSAADHLPDLKLDPCAAAAAHRWGHPEDRAACQVDRAREDPADRAEDPARGVGAFGFCAAKTFLLVGRTKTNALADAIVPERRGVGSEEVKDHSIGAPRSVQPVDGVITCP